MSKIKNCRAEDYTKHIVSVLEITYEFFSRFRARSMDIDTYKELQQIILEGRNAEREVWLHL